MDSGTKIERVEEEEEKVQFEFDDI